jgi:hypothetical protein
MDSVRIQDALSRMQTEYVEMPGLKLTARQAQRLWSLSVEVCNDALAILLAGGFLTRTRDGAFIRQGRPPLSLDAVELPIGPI